MRLAIQVRLAVCCLCIPTNLFAATITGKVENGTTSKAVSGDQVVLLTLAGGMEETARTKTDSKGQFTIDVSDEGTQHLIRVTHQGVNYFHAAPQGTTSVEITVYNSAKKVDRLIGEGRIVRVLSAGEELEISEMYILRNESNPRRTWMSDRTFEVALPEGAKLEQGMAAGPGGMPVTTSLVAAGSSNHYAFVYPLRPGRSQLQVTYKLPYSGSHDFAVTTDMPLAELGVMLPKSMRFNSTEGSFSPASDESGMAVFVAKSVSPGQQMKFSVSGQGSAPREAQAGASDSGQSGAPVGGLGAPAGAPDAMSGSHWYILAGVAVIMAVFAAWTLRRHAVAGKSPGSTAITEQSTVPSLAKRERQLNESPNQGRTPAPGSVLEALKDELFQLETERLQGRISQEEYAAAKAGLDTLIRRQLKNNG